MLTLKSLTFSGIGRFVDEQTIDFTALSSLVQVDGQNNNTGGSSGSGKSTIFKALEFLLGLNDISNGILQSRLTKEAMSVTGLFELDGAPLKIQRNKKLLIELNGQVTTGSSKLTEELLDQIIGMPRDLFRKILHKRQGEGGFFLDMGATDTHKFFTSCLTLEKEQAKILTLDDRVSQLTDAQTSLKSALESHKAALQATRSALDSLGPMPVLELDPGARDAFLATYMSALDLYNLVKDGHKKEVEALEAARPQVSAVPFDRSNIELAEKDIGMILADIAKLEKAELARQQICKDKIAELQIMIRDLDAKEAVRVADVRSKLNLCHLSTLRAAADETAGAKAKVAAIALAKELEKIRAQSCPTCEQSWATEAAKAKEAQMLAQLQEYKKVLVAGLAATKELVVLRTQADQLNLELQPRLDPNIACVQDQIAQIRVESQPQVLVQATELKLVLDFKKQALESFRKQEGDHQIKESLKTKDILDLYAQKQTELRTKHQFALQGVQDALNRADSDVRQAENTFRSFEEAKKRYTATWETLCRQQNGYNHKIGHTEEELRLVTEELELATESKKAIKSYLSCSFEDALDSIGDQATKFIRAVPNMGTATVQFEGLKETKEGKVKEEVTCIISMDGEIGVPVKSLSGGERSSTDLAIDLAVIKFIEERTGKGIDLFVLDEAFTGLDSKNILEALEMLKECSADKRLLIVDHNPEAAQFIEDRILVVRDGLTSQIVRK